MPSAGCLTHDARVAAHMSGPGVARLPRATRVTASLVMYQVARSGIIQPFGFSTWDELIALAVRERGNGQSATGNGSGPMPNAKCPMPMSPTAMARALKQPIEGQPGRYRAAKRNGRAVVNTCAECCEPDEPLLGACCFANGTCENTTQQLCQSLGGNFRGVGTVCGPDVCPVEPAPCCSQFVGGRLPVCFVRCQSTVTLAVNFSVTTFRRACTQPTPGNYVVRQCGPYIITGSNNASSTVTVCPAGQLRCQWSLSVNAQAQIAPDACWLQYLDANTTALVVNASASIQTLPFSTSNPLNMTAAVGAMTQSQGGGTYQVRSCSSAGGSGSYRSATPNSCGPNAGDQPYYPDESTHSVNAAASGFFPCAAAAAAPPAAATASRPSGVGNRGGCSGCGDNAAGVGGALL